MGDSTNHICVSPVFHSCNMITHIKINGFKSFHNFEMMFTPFTVIAGINASGKSNLFDALELLSAIASGKKTLKEI